MPIDTSYRPLTEEEQAIGSGQLLPSGEANFADFEYKDEELANNPDNQPTGTGIIDSALAPFFGLSPYSSAANSPKNVSDLSTFFPYIHYYPATRVQNLSLYEQTTVSNFFTIDYSLVFEFSNYYNWYTNYGQYEFGADFGADPSLLPPRNFY